MKSIKAVKTYTLYTLFIVLATVSVSSLFVLIEIHKEAMFQANFELNQRMKVFEALLVEKGGVFSINGGQLFVGRHPLNNNVELPDRLTGIFGGAFTIFMGDQRISTSIKGPDGTRIVGTRLVGPAYDAIFIRGEAYSGEADIQGTRYITAYKPIKDASGSIVGALYSGVKKDDYLSHFDRFGFGAVGLLLFIAGVFSALYYSLYKQGKLSEQQGANEVAFLQTLIDTIPTPVFYKDQQGCYLGCNQAFEALVGFGRDSVIGRSACDVIVGQELVQEQNKIEQDLLAAPPGTKHSIEARVTSAAGTVRDVVIFRTCYRNEAGKNQGIIASILDITERKKLGQIMVETEKMLMVGGLAAGMAHELNNPIGAIMQNIQNLQRRLSSELGANRRVAGSIGLDIDLMHDYLEQRGINEMLDYISKSSVQAARIVSNMLDFCRQGPVEKCPVPLHDLIDNAIEFVGCDYDFGKGDGHGKVDFVKDYDQRVQMLIINRSEIEQVMANLIRNAIQALEEGCSDADPKIFLRTRLIERGVVIEVEDNGPGMAQEIQNRIFEPFFTTKEIGSGTGLGLAVAYNLVVNNHQGNIRVDSLPGRGTKFSVILPLIAKAVSGTGLSD